MSFNDTLNFITSIKLQELEKQRLDYQKHTAPILSQVHVTDGPDALDALKKIRLLSENIEKWKGSGSVDSGRLIDGKFRLSTAEKWIRQAELDPSLDVPHGSEGKLVDSWADAMENHIKQVGRRFDCAKLFGELFKEWLASGDSSTSASLNVNADEGEEAPAATVDFVDVGRIEKVEQQEKFSSIVFNGFKTDTEGLKAYLEELFSSQEAREALNNLRSVVKKFGKRLSTTHFSTVNVKNAINGLLSSGLMDEAKRATLKEILSNETVQKEVASVLKMRLQNLDKWAWPETGVVVEFRKHLNGKYRAFTDPDVIDALLLQHLGVEWQIIFKRAFTNIVHSRAWKSAHRRPTGPEADRLEKQIGNPGQNTIEKIREKSRLQHFFVSQLSSSATRPSTYDDLLDAPDGENDANGVLTPAAVKQKLLYILATENNLNKTLYNSHAIVRSDFEWFGPSLPHSSIITVFEFFGMEKEWITFFQRFLEAPLRFKEDPVGQVMTRMRGTPISYALSIICGEAVMFAMDFAVNQRAEGLFLYRMHDDLWIWDKDPRKCAMAWREMGRYSDLVGIKFNMSKTGSAVFVSPESQIYAKEAITSLPQGGVRWGFLTFNAEKGRFIIDQKDVDSHIKEMKRQLDAAKSVFGWVNIYNKYMQFFLRNFGGRPARSYGKEHIEDTLQTLSRIQRELFAGIPGGVVGHLRGVLEKKFNVIGLPEGYFHLPIVYGGLEVRNPLVEVLSLPKETAGMGASWYVKQKEKLDPMEYEASQSTWEYNKDRPKDMEFLSYEEYEGLRETHLDTWASRYQGTLDVIEVHRVEPSPDVIRDLEELGVDYDDSSLSIYLSWACVLHGRRLLEHFGSIKVVDEDLIPVGMVEVFKGSRMKLDE